MTMGSGLGDFEQLVLLAVLRLDNDAYAVSVRDEIARNTGRRVSRGAVYVTLGRLEEKGLLASALGDPTPERGGKAKRLFTVRSEGLAALRVSLGEIRRMASGLDERLGFGTP